MSTTIVINPDYQFLEEFVRNLPRDFDKDGELIYNARNQIRKYNIDGQPIAVKRYKIPNIFTRIDYTFIRESKARRAFEYAIRLKELGIDTPTPIAYIEITNRWLFKQSYFVSVFTENTQDVRALTGRTDEELSELIPALARFTADLHRKGVFHIDFSPGNILYSKDENGFRFYLIDINRMKFGITDRNTLLKNFERLTDSHPVLEYFAREYAREMKIDEEKFVADAFRARERFEKKIKHKKKLKRFIR